MSETSHTDRVNLQTGHGDTIDPATGLRHWRANYGRPRWDLLFAHFTSSVASSTTDIGVFTCGPKPLTRELRSLCHSHSGANIRFKFHKENF